MAAPCRIWHKLYSAPGITNHIHHYHTTAHCGGERTPFFALQPSVTYLLSELCQKNPTLQPATWAPWEFVCRYSESQAPEHCGQLKNGNTDGTGNTESVPGEWCGISCTVVLWKDGCSSERWIVFGIVFHKNMITCDLLPLIFFLWNTHHSDQV